MLRCNKHYQRVEPVRGSAVSDAMGRYPVTAVGHEQISSKWLRHQAGITLVELVISIVIVGIAGTALLQGLGFLTMANVDPMLRSQSNLLAQSMLNEVMGQSFFEPDFDPRTDPSVTPFVCINPESDGGYDRRLWDNICDYQGFNSSNPDNGISGIRDKNGNTIAGLNSYVVVVGVDISNSVGLGSGADRVENTSSCSAARVLRVDVTVTDPRGQDFLLTGYRTSYWDEGC